MFRRCTFVVILAVLSLALAFALASCGGNSASMHTAPAPVFTSTPVTAAVQATPYAYQVAATDPAGGTVSFALTTAPSGATLSGASTVNWTPTPSQSRVPNAFTVTATTSEGGTNTQSWSVSPSGTVTITSIITNWTTAGPVTTPDSDPVEDALVPNSDGSVTVLAGVQVSPGVYNIENVPAGYYWLVLGLNTTQLFNAFWTNTSSFDAGRNVAGSPTAITSSPETTIFNFALSGLNAATAPDYIVFMTDGFLPPPVSWQPPTGAQTSNVILATTSGPYNTVDWSQINSAFLLQYDATALGSLNLLTLGPELTLSNLSFTDGATNNVTETLQAATPASLNVSVQGSQWADLLNNAGPSQATAGSSWLSVAAQPYVTGGTNSPAGFSGPNLYMFMPAPGSELTSSVWPYGTCAPGLGGPFSSQPAISTDQNLGTLQYGDPFPSTWTRTETFCQGVLVTFPAGTPPENFVFLVSDGESSAPSSSAIVPAVSPVQNPMLNAVSLFTAATVSSTTPTLSWTAPATGAPYGYSIVPWQIFPLQNNSVELASAGTFSTAQTSMTLPPLAAGNYLFVITAQTDATANIQTSPYRSQLPTGYASLVSAPITISSTAMGPKIRGDASVIKRLSQPVEFRQAVPARKR